ncbi:MAG: HAMP domain-containing sensor histidine kinase [Lachnospiraceae bacterium]|nr:HAMP domain-containing sensor histidine kinase [Lachnospiraceae bacterium]
MNENYVIFLLSIGVILFGTVIGWFTLRFHRIKSKLSEIEEILGDIQSGNGNRKILLKEQDVLAPLGYQMNEIVHNYEEQLVVLRQEDEANKQLLTSLSHDVRTPLTTLIGYLDAVHSKMVFGEEQEEYIETARRRAYDLKHYIDSLFDWFRLNSDEFSLSIQKIEAAEETRNILKDWIPIFRERDMDFDIQIPEKRIMVNLDVDGYTRIINNLIQNVVTHSKASSITILMEAELEKMKLSIYDNGIGINKEDITHIFSRLYKCDKGRSEKGSGLGLSIVSQMVDHLGGEIYVKSEVNQYTKFILELPIAS